MVDMTRATPTPSKKRKVDSLQPVSVTLLYDREGEMRLSPPKAVPVAVTPELASVFARAAVANTNDPTPLSFSSLLVGMTTGTGQVSDWLRSEMGLDPKKIADSRGRRYDERSMGSAEWDGRPLLTSVSARRAIEEAQSIAAATENASTIGIRHLAAAYPVLRYWHESDFAELGIDRLAWCRAFGGFMARSHPAEKRYWRAYADRASPVPLPSFNADVYSEKDLLDIDRTVDALALLIASTRTGTPLSIGVFGPWGSGKSFFMRHLRKKIWGLAEREQKRAASWIEKRTTQKATEADAPLYYGQIAQVEFNAWHYNEGNLVASLVDHLFRNLRVLPGSKDKELERRQADVLLKMSGAKDEVSSAGQALEDARKRRDDADAEVKRANETASVLRSDVDAKQKELNDTSSAAEAARKDLDDAIRGLAEPSNVPDPAAAGAVLVRQIVQSPVAGEIRAAGESLMSVISDWRRFAGQLFTLRGAVVVALCLLAPAVAMLTTELSAVWAGIAGAATGVAASVSHVVAFIRERRKEFEQKLRELQEEETRRVAAKRDQLEQEQATLKAEWDGKLKEVASRLEAQQAVLRQREESVAAAVRGLADRTKELDEIVARRSAAETRLREYDEELRKLSSALLLDEFIKDRAGTDEYHKQLSFLALVRRDFERLSDLIAEANAEWRSPSSQSGAPLLNRIVLYIDDLDRCQVETVMKVLEAVHLLLAFPLFVCVVAVDPRWVEKCLHQKHEHLFADEGQEDGARATVGDYLEKIFQIPIWMRPIDAQQRSSLVRELLGTTAAAEPKRAPSPANDLPGELAEPQIHVKKDPVDGFQAAVGRAAENRDPLRITAEEASFVDKVGPLLSDKPRALIRFVNIYRLLKASLPDLDRQSFVTNDASSPYRICLSQLAFFTGHPRVGPLLAKQLQINAPATDCDLLTWYEGLPDDVRSTLGKAFGLIPDVESVSLEKFRSWLPDTAKYLFHRQT